MTEPVECLKHTQIIVSDISKNKQKLNRYLTKWRDSEVKIRVIKLHESKQREALSVQSKWTFT